MTNANTQVIARTAAIVAGLGLVLAAFAVAFPANAQTTTTTTTTTSSASTCASFNRDLTIGSTGVDVTALQNFLISKGYSIPAGATGYFGGQTQAAVAQYQAASGITPAAGYFGPITRGYHAAHCGTTTGGGDDDDDDDDDSDDDSGDLEGGEADLSDFEINDEDPDGSEGEEMVEIASIEFDVEDGDVMVERIEFVASSTDDSLEEQPWDFFDTLYILDGDGDEVGEVDASDRDEWDEEDENGDEGDEYRIAFTDLDTIVREDDRAMFTLAGDIAGSIDTTDQDQEFDFLVPEDGVRAVDSEDIQHYIPSADSDTVTFGFDEEESGDLDISTSGDDPDATTLISDEDDETEIDEPVFVFEIENNDDVDVLVTDITLDVATSSGDSIDSLLDSVTLVVDGDEFDGDINDDGTVDFDDIDVLIGGDEEVSFEVMITVAEDADGTIQFSIDDTDVTAEGDDSGDDADVSGSADGSTHTIAATGIVVTPDGTSASVNDDGNVGTFTIDFTVEALEDDIYIYNGADDSFTASTTGVRYNIYSSGTATTTFAVDSAVLQDGADVDESGNYYIVRNGDSGEFTLTVTLDPSASATALYSVELEAIKFGVDATSGTADDTTYTVPDDQDFETDPVSIEAT